MTYDASSITVLGDNIARERFGFKRAQEIHDRHRWCALDWCERLVAACDMAGWDLALAERRYCQLDRSITPPPEFLEIYRELEAEERRKIETRLSEKR